MTEDGREQVKMRLVMNRIVLLLVFALCSFPALSQDKKLDVPERGVQLMWEKPAEVDIGAIHIYRRAMDHRVNTDLTDVPWTLIEALPPDTYHWRDTTAQVSVTYEYKIVSVNTTGVESDPMVLKVTVPNEASPKKIKTFRVNAFDPQPLE